MTSKNIRLQSIYDELVSTFALNFLLTFSMLLLFRLCCCFLVIFISFSLEIYPKWFKDNFCSVPCDPSSSFYSSEKNNYFTDRERSKCSKPEIFILFVFLITKRYVSLSNKWCKYLQGCDQTKQSLNFISINKYWKILLYQLYALE